jgi:hypothetical protein
MFYRLTTSCPNYPILVKHLENLSKGLLKFVTTPEKIEVLKSASQMSHMSCLSTLHFLLGTPCGGTVDITSSATSRFFTIHSQGFQSSVVNVQNSSLLANSILSYIYFFGRVIGKAYGSIILDILFNHK